MSQSIQEKDRPLLVILPIIIKFIESGTDLTEKEIKSMARLHPKEFEYAKRNPVSEMYKVAEKYRDHKLYRDLLEIVFSEKGKKWIERNSNICEKLAINKKQ